MVIYCKTLQTGLFCRCFCQVILYVNKPNVLVYLCTGTRSWLLPSSSSSAWVICCVTALECPISSISCLSGKGTVDTIWTHSSDWIRVGQNLITGIHSATDFAQLLWSNLKFMSVYLKIKNSTLKQSCTAEGSCTHCSFNTTLPYSAPVGDVRPRVTSEVPLIIDCKSPMSAN